MNIHPHTQKFDLPLILLILFLSPISQAQLISLKSVPVAAGDQFMVFPSMNVGMGGVSIAMDDPLLDPFINPAKGDQIKGVQLFGSPTFYNISNDNGSGRTLPLGVLFGAEKWFGGISVAVQHLAPPESPSFVGIQPQRNFTSSGRLLREKNSNNLYVSGLVGTRIPETDISCAAGLFWADLDAVGGVELLYPRSLDIEQFGHMVDYRIGFFGELSGKRLFEVLLLYNQFEVTHDVTYPVWLFNTDRFFSPITTSVERNLDYTNTWGLHLGYVQPLDSEESKIGFIFTANRKTHPKIPNYELMNIPRDPGNSTAFNIGLGISRSKDQAIFGIDLIFEPIVSNTWADTSEPVETRSGWIIPSGGKTVENDFQFTNWLLRIGLDRQKKEFGFQLGIQVHWIRYWLNQKNYVEEFERSQKERWAEWTPSIGFSWTFPEFQIRYTGSWKRGTGLPGIDLGGASGFVRMGEVSAANDIIIAPSGSLTLSELNVFTHQISISIPIRE